MRHVIEPPSAGQKDNNLNGIVFFYFASTECVNCMMKSSFIQRYLAMAIERQRYRIFWNHKFYWNIPAESISVCMCVSFCFVH